MFKLTQDLGPRLIAGAFFLALALICMAVPVVAVGDVSIVQKGYFEVVVEDQVVSQHSTYRKALEEAVNHNATEIRITAPDVEVSKETRDVTISWDPPTARQNGEPLPADQVAGYRLYVEREGEFVELVDVDKAEAVVAVPPGEWTFAVTTLDQQGNESRLSETATIDGAGGVTPGR